MTVIYSAPMVHAEENNLDIPLGVRRRVQRN